MAGGGGTDSLAAAAEAVAGGDWATAFDLLTAADAAGELMPEHLPLLGEAAYASGDLDVTIDAWERLHATCVAAGDHASAAGAAVRVAMHLMMDTGLMAPVRGWLARAERLLDGHDESPIHAHLALVRTYERLLTGDVESTRRWAEHTIEVGTRQSEPGPVAVGRIALGRTLICDGEVDRGLALLDEAAVATVSGELDPLSVGMVYCELVCAMQGLAQYDRAAEWTEAMTRWSQSDGIGSLHGRCRVHRAELLRIRGDCEAAEHEARQACDELRPWMRREYGWPLTELGQIRLRRGDLVGAAEAFAAARDSGWDPQPGLALLHLAQGDAEGAALEIRHALDHQVPVPSKERPPNQELARAPLLAAAVEVAVATGDADWARSAADELADIAERFRSKALQATAALADGRALLVQDDPSEAIAALDCAVALWSEVGAPWEAAMSRADLATALATSGRHDRAGREATAAQAALAELGGAPSVAAEPDSSPARSPQSEGPEATFVQEGEDWTLALDGESARVRDLKGMHYLARLLAEPGREFHVLDLVAAERPPVPGGRDDGREDGLVLRHGDDPLGPLLDDQAKATYKRRLTEIDQDIEEARALGDAQRETTAEAERDFLVRELARAVGLAGRDRPVGSSSERARASVTRAIRYALDRIGRHHARLAEHLEHAIRTGTYCAYEPDPRAVVRWLL